jgi:hypothetical protein
VRANAVDDAEIYVVAPASQISRLDWLTNAEDDARADALELVEQTAEAVLTDNVEPHVSDADPLQAIEGRAATVPSRFGDRRYSVPAKRRAWLETGAAATAQAASRSRLHILLQATERGDVLAS